MIQGLLHGERWSDRHIFGRHQTPDAAFGIAQKLGGDFPLLGGKHLHQALADLAGQFFEKGGPVVGVQIVEQACHLVHIGGQTLDDGFLLGVGQVGEGFFGGQARQQAKDHKLVLLGQLLDDPGYIDGLKAVDLMLDELPASLFNEFLKKGFDFVHQASPLRTASNAIPPLQFQGTIGML